MLRLVLLALSAFALPASASAKPSSSAVDLETLHVFADCMVDRYGPGVRRLLALDYRSSAYDSALQTLAREGSRCVPFVFGKLRSDGVLMGGAFAEKLLPGALSGSRLADRIAYKPSGPTIAARDDGEYLALCTVRTMPDEVAVLLATRPASEEERLAVGNLRPRLGPCLRAGAAARINVPGLRAILALAAYRLVSQQSPAGGRPRASLSFKESFSNA